MSLAPGTRLGPYEVTAQIGAGGMGEVYQATDTNLHRLVAIKVLPEALAQDGDRLARFEREAKTLAQLNHPHIATIHGVEKSQGVYALVMELVEGPTLADRLARGAMPVEEAVAVARQIALALEAAHGQGIVHRDLKPANVKIRPDGAVKVLDFGLAKTAARAGPTSSDLSQSPTFTSPVMTEAGIILGTAAYMSPEQARGQPVDKRTDVWAFGCLLYEMLTGTAAFKGDNFSDVVANVLHKDSDWTALPRSAAPLTGILTRCLEKDVTRRLRDLGDAALLLDDAMARPSQSAPPAAKVGAHAWWIAAGIAGAIAGAAGGALFEANRAPAEPEPVGRFQLAAQPGAPFAADPSGQNVIVSPDGSTMVYTSTRRGTPGLVVQRLDELQGQLLAAAEGGTNPIFSPDGKEIAFTTFTALKRASLAGGPATTICPVNPYFGGASWGAQGVIVFAEKSFGLFRVSASGGQPEKITMPDAAKQEYAFASPFVLPDGQTVVYTVVMSDGSSRIAARRLGHEGVSTLVEDGFGPQYLPSGHLVFGRADRLMAVRFDAATLQMKGTPVAVEQGISTKTADYVANFSAAANGTAVYVLGRDEARLNRVVWTDRRGMSVGALIDQPIEFPRNLRVSPDGRRAVLTIGPPSNGQIWVYDLSRAAQPLKLTFRDHGAFPVWSPDGKRIAFLWRTTTNLLSWIAADGTSEQPETIRSEDDLAVPLDWSPDGSFLLYQIPPPRGAAKIGVLNLKDNQSHQWLPTTFSDWGGRLSPNGKWLAYASDQTGSTELWVRPFPGPGAPVRISSSGGRKPMWSRDGKEIFFENGPQLLSARVTAEAPDFRVEAPNVLFEGGFTRDDADPVLRYMDVAPDGRFLMAEPVEKPGASSIVVAPHWVEELTRLPDKKS